MRPTSELRQEVRLEIVSNGLSGQVLSGWWQDDWKPARSHAVSGAGGWYSSEWSGERKADGVHVWIGPRYTGTPASVHDHNFERRIREPDVVMAWTEVRDIVVAGATPERRDRYSAAYRAYCDHATRPLPHPPLRPGQRRELGLPEHDDSEPHPENVAFWEEGTRIHVELGAAGHDILRAGVELVMEREAANEQLLLW